MVLRGSEYVVRSQTKPIPPNSLLPIRKIYMSRVEDSDERYALECSIPKCHHLCFLT